VREAKATEEIAAQYIPLGVPGTTGIRMNEH